MTIAKKVFYKDYPAVALEYDVFTGVFLPEDGAKFTSFQTKDGQGFWHRQRVKNIFGWGLLPIMLRVKAYVKAHVLGEYGSNKEYKYYYTEARPPVKCGIVYPESKIQRVI